MELTPGQWLLTLTALTFGYFAFTYGVQRKSPTSLRTRLRTIIIPKLTLERATITEALEELGRAAERSDAKGMGIPFTTAIRTDEEISVAFEKQPLWDALEGIALLYSLNYHIDDVENQVELYLQSGNEELMSRRYSPSGEIFPKPWAVDFKMEFEGVGIEFPDTGFAHYDRRILTIKATENTLNIVEKIFSLDPMPDV